MQTSPRRYQQLQPEDRVTMASLLQQNHSLRDIAAVLNRSPSTISRERHRNIAKAVGIAPVSPYASVIAQRSCQQRRRAGRPLNKLHPDRPMFEVTRHLLGQRWSPEQIALTLAALYPKGVTLEKRGMVWQRLVDGAYMASHTLLPRAPQLNDENYLVEVAAPVMERLCRKVNWPSVLAVPRLDCMEVVETNRPKSYFSHVPVGPIGFRINMLRSASGRAYIAFCSESERQAMLQRLVASNEPGNFMARQPAMVERLLDETRRLGYGHRTPDFGGHFDQTRREWNDDRDSIAVPIWAGEEVIAALNMTWMNKVATVPQIVKAHLPVLTAASREISMRLVGT